MTSLLFAYGTLMPTDPKMAKRQGWRPDAVRGRLYDLGPYPALVDLDVPSADWVLGFVKCCEPAELEAYDRWEDVESGLYRRVQTITRNNERAWVYVYGRPLPADAVGPVVEWRARA